MMIEIETTVRVKTSPEPLIRHEFLRLGMRVIAVIFAVLLLLYTYSRSRINLIDVSYTKY